MNSGHNPVAIILQLARKAARQSLFAMLPRSATDCWQIRPVALEPDWCVKSRLLFYTMNAIARTARFVDVARADFGGVFAHRFVVWRTQARTHKGTT
jgi:hypothetical protein